jgi:hypothetical protein
MILIRAHLFNKRGKRVLSLLDAVNPATTGNMTMKNGQE